MLPKFLFFICRNIDKRKNAITKIGSLYANHSNKYVLGASSAIINLPFKTVGAF